MHVFACLVVVVSLVAALAAASDALLDFERANNQSLLWGPYRPNLYFGIRPRTPDGLLMALMWARVSDYQSIQEKFRYTCEQQGMAGYGWDRYDPRTGGVQTIHDADNEIDITTSFVKDTTAGDKGGNWAVRISGTPRSGASQDLKTTLIFSVASLSTGLTNLEVAGDAEIVQDPQGIEGDVVLSGENPELGPFKIRISAGHGNRPQHDHPSAAERPLDRSFVASLNVPHESLWQSKHIVFNQLGQSVDHTVEKYGRENSPPPFQLYTMESKGGPGNTQLIQKVFEGRFEFDVVYTSGASDQSITYSDLTDRLASTVGNFDEKFEKLFTPQAPFTSRSYSEMSKSLFSNLLGGIGYFHGDWLADRSYAPEYEEDNEGFWETTAQARARVIPKSEGPSELFTSIPSRPFFPRGFLWDEGFHLLPVLKWDVDLALEIVKSWFNTIDEDGWIPREQILGEEARSKVPTEFQVQYPVFANPPTLFLILANYIDSVSSPSKDAQASSSLMTKEAAKQYLSQLYPLLQRHYKWFRRTQQGELTSDTRESAESKEGYRWRGRTFKHCLPSGLDDYPRAQPPHPDELHVDAISWVGLMAQSLRKIAAFIGESGDAAKLGRQEAAIKQNIATLHWDEKEGVFCDRTLDEYEEDVTVCHKGYISLMPFLVGLLEHDDPKIGKLLDVISDPEHLWTEYGIRSLSKSDKHYGTDENYWRSPIWLNMNYLIVQRLLDLAQTKGPHRARATKLYTQLRKNLVETVGKSWAETGFAWEQYNPETGAGQRTQHFTGWTSLTVNIMAMPDLSGAPAGKDEL